MHAFAHMLDKDLNSLLNCLPDPPGLAANQQLLINQFLKRKKKKLEHLLRNESGRLKRNILEPREKAHKETILRKIWRNH